MHCFTCTEQPFPVWAWDGSYHGWCMAAQTGKANQFIWNCQNYSCNQMSSHSSPGDCQLDALWPGEVSVCSWTWIKTYFIPSQKSKMVGVFVGSCTQIFLVLWWHPCVNLGLVTALGHDYLGFLLHLSKFLRHLHEFKQAGLAMQWGMSRLDRQDSFLYLEMWGFLHSLSTSCEVWQATPLNAEFCMVV